MNQSVYMPLDLQFFNGDEGGEGSGQPSPDNNGGGTEPQASGGEGDQSTQEGGEGSNTFTQEDVNNIASKEAKKAQEKLLKQLGVEDAKSAEEGLKQYREWQEQQKTESEKLQEERDNLKTSYESTVEEKQNLEAQLSALKTGVDPDSVEDVVALAQRQVTDEVSIDDAIKSVVDKYPHFSGQQQQQQQQTKPNVSAGQHRRHEPSEVEKWTQAFKK